MGFTRRIGRPSQRTTRTRDSPTVHTHTSFAQHLLRTYPPEEEKVDIFVIFPTDHMEDLSKLPIINYLGVEETTAGSAVVP